MILGKIIPRSLFVFLMVSPLPLAGLAYLFVGTFEQELTRTVMTHLSSIADKKQDQIEAYLSERLDDAQFLANMSLTNQALDTLSALFDGSIDSVQYRNEIRKYRSDFVRFKDSSGYYDLLLIDKLGNVIFSILHEGDLGTNLNSGFLRDTALAEAQRSALALLDTQVTPVALYEPSGNNPAVFIVTPLLRDGRPIGTLAFQLDLNRLTQVTADNTGLGGTGETVLAQREGDHTLYVAPLSRISEAAFRYHVPLTETASPMRSALSGELGMGVTQDYVGVDIVSVWRYLPSLGWGMVVKMDVDEALAAAQRLRQLTWGALALLFVLSSLTALWFGRALILPIRKVTEVAGSIAGGDIDRRVPVEGWQELKELAGSFNRMADRLAEDQLLLELRVEQRTADLENANRRLQDLLTLHAAILDNAAHAIIATTPEGIITVFNRAAEDMLGYLADEVIGKQSPDIFHDSDELEKRTQEFSEQLGIPVRPGFDTIIVKSRNNKPNEHEWLYRRKDGSVIPVLLSVSTMRNVDRMISGYLGIAVDIGKLKKVEQALLDSEMRFRTIFEKASIGMAFADAEGNLLQANDSLARFLEYSTTELSDVNFAKLTYADDLSMEVGLVAEIVEGRRDDYRLEKRYVAKSGRVVWGDLTVTVLRDLQGQPINFIGMIIDITARKESEAEYRTILETTQDGFALCDSQGRFIDVNDAYCRLIGYERDELRQMTIRNIEAIESPEETQQHLDNIFKNGADRFETRHRHKDGRLLDIEVSVNYLPVGEGRLVVFLRDIGARKETEAALIEAKQSAEAANRAKSAFLANMSHEIRTPMNAILGLTQLVLETELNVRQKDFLQKVHASSKALLSILNDVLDYSKIEAGRLEIDRVPFRVESVLTSVADLFAARIEEKGLELFFEIDSAVNRTLIGDPLRLTQVLNNLVGNAIKFTNEGEVHIKVEAIEQSDDSLLLQFSVRDTGIGLSQEKAELLFQPFTQADSSITRQFGGTGLGLAICSKIVALMGGTIGAAGVEGEGAVFTFTVRVGIEAEAPQNLDLSRIRAQRVLVVDDQSTSRLILECLLTEWGVFCETSDSGEDALRRIYGAEQKNCPFSTVLLDWRMPGMSGAEVAGRLEKDCRQGLLKHPLTVIMITAYDKEQLLAQADRVHFDKILTKPVTPSVLYETLAGHSVIPKPEDKVLGAIRLEGKKILVVEDNVLNQEVVVEILQNRGASVTVAENGRVALDKLEQEIFDMVLMDLQMPEMDGFEATRRIKAIPDYRVLPVVVMSAAVMPEERARCRLVGADDFVAKPVDPSDLERVLVKWFKGLSVKEDARKVNLESEVVANAVKLPDLPGFDMDRALRRVDGNAVLLRRLLVGFFDEYSNSPAQFDRLMREQRYDEAAAMLHSIKGLAGHLGADSLSLAAAALEKDIYSGSNSDLYRSFILQLQQAVDAIANSLTPLETSGVQKSDSDVKAIAQVLNDLLPYVEERELVPEASLDALSVLYRSGQAGELLKRLRDQLDRFDYSGAMTTIERLLTLLKQDS
ncbi:PAS domain S-box protein [Methylotuvimicrobium sp. KM2]|uniref:PAS domain S-box protein n=1 Tax=Methylotuvimicrobium sp. KM2 TaxID=3133976 RepID=UPI003100F81D